MTSTSKGKSFDVKGLCLGTSEIYYQVSQNPLLPIKGKYVMMKIARSLEVNMTLFKC